MFLVWGLLCLSRYFTHRKHYPIMFSLILLTSGTVLLICGIICIDKGKNVWNQWGNRWHSGQPNTVTLHILQLSIHAFSLVVLQISTSFHLRKLLKKEKKGFCKQMVYTFKIMYKISPLQGYLAGTFDIILGILHCKVFSFIKYMYRNTKWSSLTV